MSNYWADHALMNDHHLGDAREAAMIVAENGTDAPLVCGQCGGSAPYRATVLTEQCTSCRSLHIVSIDQKTHEVRDFWS